MNKKELRSAIQGLLNSHIDGTKKKVSGWHLDYIDPVLLSNKKLWYQKGFEYFVASYLLARQMHVPWGIELAMYLKNKKKPCEVTAFSLADLRRYFSDTPPEIVVHMCNNDSITNELLAVSLANLPTFISCNLYQTYDSRDCIYSRILAFTIRKSCEFQIMIAQLIDRDSFDFVNLSSARLVDQRRIAVLRKLLVNRPADCACLIEFGALLLLASHDINEAIDIFNKVLTIEAQNIDARFWLATIYYYCLNDLKKAEHYLKESLNIVPSDAKCLSFMYLVSWDITKSQVAGISYLEKAIESAPNWLLPRIQLALFFLFEERWEDAQNVLNKILVGTYAVSNKIIDRYYAAYVSGNTRDGMLIVEELNKIVSYGIISN